MEQYAYMTICIYNNNYNNNFYIYNYKILDACITFPLSLYMHRNRVASVPTKTIYALCRTRKHTYICIKTVVHAIKVYYTYIVYAKREYVH